jgi:hypothetical protein
MKKIAKYRPSIIVIFSIVLCVFILIKCISNNNGKHQDNKAATVHTDDFKKFAGSAACANCHKNIYEKHIHTAHYLTSQPAFKKYIKGSFDIGKNIYPFDEYVVVAMEERDSGFYQVEYYKGIEKKARRFDIVVGSGTMGQSFLYWMHNQLFQLPITYFTAANMWSNSPGYPDKVVFNRPITSRCLECHSTYAKTISAIGKEPEEFDHNQMIYGVDCEKCHGPAAKHVEFQTQNPKETQAKYIINPAALSRVQNLELCALCHGGRLHKTKPSFEFTAGDTLANFFVMDTTAPNPDNIDVHANQYGLLRASKCFRMSSTLTCNSCHSTHENEKGKTTLFSQRCMACHNKEHGTFCKINPSLVTSIKSNCIDCHMPLKSSRAIAVMLPGDNIPTAALIRSHYISIYPEESKKIIDFVKKGKSMPK